MLAGPISQNKFRGTYCVRNPEVAWFKSRPRYSSKMKIRESKPTDAELFSRLYYLAESELYANEEPLTQESFARMLAGGDVALVAVVNGEDVGCITMSPDFRYGAELHFMYVHKEYQGKGIGSELLMRMESEARNLDKAKIYLHTKERNARAISLYERLGYEIIETVEGRYPSGDLAVLMSKEIKACATLY